jgi:hypothetical protein
MLTLLNKIAHNSILKKLLVIVFLLLVVALGFLAGALLNARNRVYNATYVTYVSAEAAA